MQRPQALKKGDKVAIVSTARKIEKEELNAAIKIMEGWGLEVTLGDTIGAQDHQYAGSDELRANDFQKALNNQEINAIFCARGGYGTVRIIDKVDFSNFESNPKWIIGYSDITVLHCHIHNNYSAETLHANMPITYPDAGENESTRSIWRALSQGPSTYKWRSSKHNRKGRAEGLLVGGNLSVLYSIMGSVSDIDTNGKILFIEDLDEYLYHIDRMMVNMKRSGKLAKLSGLIVGGMSDMRDNNIPFGKNAKDIISEHVNEYNYPVAFDFPAGHIDDNRAIVLGAKVILNVDSEGASLA
jgi:muramoyltetrapeptide carboxypeptidase